MEKDKPQQIRLGHTRIAVWKNEDKSNGSVWFNWNVEKRYKKDGKWETTQSFRDADAPVVIFLLVVGSLRMIKQLIATQND
jgi:hypothetical protein